MLLLALLIAIPRVLCWDIQPAGQTVNFQLQVGTIRGVGHVEFLPDCPTDWIITPPIETTTDAAPCPPSHTEDNPQLTTLLLNSTETATHTVVKKVTRTVVVTITDQSQPTTPAIPIPSSESWVWVPPRGTAPTARTNATNGSFTIGLPAPSFISELSLSPGNALIQQVWVPLVVMIAVCFGQSCF